MDSSEDASKRSPSKAKLIDRPPPLTIPKYSHNIKKLCPDIIHTTNIADFRTAVHRLTGLPYNSISGSGDVSPAAALGSLEKVSPKEKSRISKNEHVSPDDSDEEEGGESVFSLDTDLNPFNSSEIKHVSPEDSLNEHQRISTERKSTTRLKNVKINKGSGEVMWLELMVNDYVEYLEFESCSFTSFEHSYCFPITLKKLKVINCENTENVFRVLLNQKDLSLESLEIDSCSCSCPFSLPLNNLPVTLTLLKIVNCVNLKSLSESSEVENIHSGLSNTTMCTLKLRELEIWDCLELEFLHEDLHNLTHLDLLSINNCCSLVSFPAGGLPKNSLTSLVISECESLSSLPYQLHKATPLLSLTIRNCPSLVSFPKGGLPPNLHSLSIINCESFVSPCYWDLYKLKHLKNYSFIGGDADSEE